MKIDNLYEHADGGFYCLLSDDAPMKNPADDEWLPGVIYTGTDGKMRSTTTVRWKRRFKPVADYAGDDIEVLNMIRRCNPGNADFDFIRVFESWHEAEAGITAAMLEMAVGACIEAFVWGGAEREVQMGADGETALNASILLKTADLDRVLHNYDVEREAVPHGFRITVRK